MEKFFDKATIQLSAFTSLFSQFFSSTFFTPSTYWTFNNAVVLLECDDFFISKIVVMQKGAKVSFFSARVIHSIYLEELLPDVKIKQLHVMLILPFSKRAVFAAITSESLYPSHPSKMPPRGGKANRTKLNEMVFMTSPQLHTAAGGIYPADPTVAISTCSSTMCTIAEPRSECTPHANLGGASLLIFST